MEAGKRARAPWNLPFNWRELALFGRPDGADGKRHLYIPLKPFDDIRDSMQTKSGLCQTVALQSN